MGRIPDRWLPYSPMGSIVPGTRFIACKVPLKDDLLRSLPEKERFGPKNLLEAFPKVGLLIDLTNTTRYYFEQDFTSKNIRYEKIFCPGKVVPPNSIIKQFFDVVDGYRASEVDPDAVIVVHCTHGVNRTGYFICRYMIEKLKMSPEEAIKNFQMARGHDIERDNYVSDLKNGCKGGNESDLKFISSRGGKINFHRQVPKSRNRFHDEVFNRREEIPEKRQRNCYKQSFGYKQSYNNCYPDGRRCDDQPRNTHFNNFDRRRNPEEEKNYSYNWRDHKNNQSSFTTPLPQFTPAHHQANGSSIPRQTPNLTPHEPDPSAVTNDGERCSRPIFSFRKPPIEGFNPLPKFCYPEKTNEAEMSSRTRVSISHQEDPGRSAMLTTGFEGFERHFSENMSNRGRSRRGHSRGNRGGFRRWRNKHSRKCE